MSVAYPISARLEEQRVLVEEKEEIKVSLRPMAEASMSQSVSEATGL